MTARNRLASKIASLTPAATAFLLGSAAFMLVDVVIARFAPTSEVDDWTSLKAFMYAIGSLSLLGIDQLIVREPSKFGILARPVLSIGIVLAAIAAALVWATGLYDNWWILFGASAALSVSMLFFGALRGRRQFGAAHLARDGWKAILLLLLWPAYFALEIPLGVLLLFSLALSISFAAAALRREYSTGREPHDEIHDLRSALSVSWPLWLAAIALSVAAYGELMLVNALGSPAEVAYYLKSLILFTYPAVLGNAFFGTVSVPQIRNNPELAVRLVKTYWAVPLAALVLAPAAAFLFGLAIAPILFPGYRADLALAVLLSLGAAMRIAHTLVSSFVVALAPSREVRSYCLALFLFACLTPVVCWLLSMELENVGVTVALAGLLHWALRGLTGMRMLIAILRRYGDGDASAAQASARR